MALADPLPITVNVTTTNLPKVSTQGLSSVYQNADETLKETISHQIQQPKGSSGRRVRSLIRVDQRTVVADPVSGVNSDFDTLSVQLVIERPEYGFTVTQVDYLVQALKAQLTTAIVTKLYGKES